LELARLNEYKNKREKIGLSWELSTDAFINEKRINNLSEETIKWYSETLTYLHSFCVMVRVDCPEKFTKEHLNQWILYMKQTRGNKASSINSKLRAIRPFFNYLYESGFITEPLKVKLLKEDKPIIKVFTTDHIKKLIAKPDLDNCSFAYFRDWAICCFFLGTGCRLRTLRNIRIKHIDFVQKEIFFSTTKNRREQIIPLSPTLESVLTAYLKVRGGTGEDYLFCNSFGEQLAKRSCEERFKLYCQSKGIDSSKIRLSPHTARHTFGTQSLLNGMDIYSIQRMMGHSTLTMLQKYIQISQVDLKGRFMNPLDTVGCVAKQSTNRKAILMPKRSK
jgi:integrase/recombinase XerD